MIVRREHHWRCWRVPNPEGFTYVGSAFIALAGDERDKLRARLDKVEQCPLARFQFPDVQWVKPRLVARVRYLAGTKYIRHGTVRGFA